MTFRPNPFENAYRNPADDIRDRGYLSALTDIIHRWYRARNGQNEAVEIACQWGLGRDKRSLTLIIRCHVIPK